MAEEPNVMQEAMKEAQQAQEEKHDIGSAAKDTVDGSGDNPRRNETNIVDCRPTEREISGFVASGATAS